MKLTVSDAALQKKLLDIGKDFDAKVVLWASQRANGIYNMYLRTIVTSDNNICMQVLQSI